MGIERGRQMDGLINREGERENQVRDLLGFLILIISLVIECMGAPRKPTCGIPEPS